MARYRYVKAPVVSQAVSEKNNDYRRGWRTIFPSVLITLGSILIANVAWPIISYQLFTSPGIRKISFVSPVSTSTLGSGELTFSEQSLQEAGTANGVPQVLGVDIDYTNPRNWFPEAEFDANEVEVNSYSIDIPSLEIFDADVLIGGDDLNTSIVHYPHTALPGELGTSVLFGHSVLRQFYNPAVDNEKRYTSIFSTIMTLKNGERIYVDYNGIRFTYEVTEKVEVQPEDLFILEQRYNNRQLKLITCTPEGTYLRRGVIVAQLVDLADVRDDKYVIH